jgi:hypothetical protein
VEVTMPNIELGLKFSAPIYKTGLQAMIYAQTTNLGNWAFANVFTWDVWLILGATSILVAFLMWGLESYSKSAQDHYNKARLAKNRNHVPHNSERAAPIPFCNSCMRACGSMKLLPCIFRVLQSRLAAEVFVGLHVNRLVLLCYCRLQHLVMVLDHKADTHSQPRRRPTHLGQPRSGEEAQRNQQTAYLDDCS